MAGYTCSKTGDKSGFKGCNRTFSTLKYFDSHFMKVTEPDDNTRDLAVIAVDGERCKTDEELIDIGLVSRPDTKVWHNPELTDRAKDI